MKLYHGSNVIVEFPKIITSEKGKDFGSAFYLTPIKSQAEKMAIRKKMIFGGKSIVSIFEWNENTNGLNYKKFEDDYEWLSLILQCRSNPSFKHNYDVVEGKIADDNVGETVLFVMDGVISKEDAVERLKYQKINSQIAFCSEKSLETLTYISSYEVK